MFENLIFQLWVFCLVLMSSRNSSYTRPKCFLLFCTALPTSCLIDFYFLYSVKRLGQSCKLPLWRRNYVLYSNLPAVLGKNRNIATAKCNIGSESLNSVPIISIVLFGFALFYFVDTGSHSADKTSLKYCVSQAGLEFTAILLLQPPAEIMC